LRSFFNSVLNVPFIFNLPDFEQSEESMEFKINSAGILLAAFPSEFFNNLSRGRIVQNLR
jgi:hypothetical protein